MHDASNVTRVLAPGDLPGHAILGVSASLKGAGQSHRRSAARGLLDHVLGRLATVYDRVGFVDLRDHPLPLFDGRFVEDLTGPVPARLAGTIAEAGGLLLSVPAYWSGPSGVFKNAIDVLCGPAYDLPKPARTIFTDKPIAAFVVGADDDSARYGAEQVTRIMNAVGSRLVAPVVSIGDLRASSDGADDLHTLVMAAADLVREVASRRGGAA